MSSEILTLCPACSAILHEGFRVDKVKVKTETPKHKSCDRCGKNLSILLDQYTVTAKRK